MLTRNSSSRTSCSVESVASDAVAQKRRRPWVVAARGAAQAEVKPAVLFTPPKERRYEQLVDEEASLPQTGQLSWASPMREAQRETSPPPSRCSQSLSQISPEVRAAIAAQPAVKQAVHVRFGLARIRMLRLPMEAAMRPAPRLCQLTALPSGEGGADSQQVGEADGQ